MWEVSGDCLNHFIHDATHEFNLNFSQPLKDQTLLAELKTNKLILFLSLCTKVLKVLHKFDLCKSSLNNLS